MTSADVNQIQQPGSLPSSERFEVRPGAFAVGPDGTVGRVRHVIVSPSGELQGLVVRTGMLRHRDVVIPSTVIISADEEVIRLRLTAVELEELPEYREGMYVHAPSWWQTSRGHRQAGALFRLPAAHETRGLQPVQMAQTGEGASGRPLTAGQRVVTRDGEAGRLHLILVDPSTQNATHFVVRRGVLRHRDIIVPVDWAEEITDDRVLLHVGLDELERLPDYRPDEEITADVSEVVWDGAHLDPDDVQHVTVRTCDGIVELRGVTTTDAARATIEAIVRRVPGVRDVRNELTSLEALAAAALDHPAPSEDKSMDRHDVLAAHVVRTDKEDKVTKAADSVSTIGYAYAWLHEFIAGGTGLDLDQDQVTQIAHMAEGKLSDLFEIAAETAAANGRGLIFRHDLPLTKGLLQTLEDVAVLSKDIEFEPIYLFLRTRTGLRAGVDDMVQADLPRLFAALLMLSGCIIAVLEPDTLLPQERFELLTRSADSRPTAWEVERAAQVLDLTL